MKNSVLQWLEKSAERLPDKTAFEDEKEQISYSELVLRAKMIGAVLAPATDARKPVPVLMEKSVRTVSCFMGIVYAGCFYVLLDPKFPAERLNTIIKTLDPEVLVTVHSEEEKLSSLDYRGKVVFEEDCGKETSSGRELMEKRSGNIIDTDPLYAIFTSGSTGIPKGVAVSHRSVMDFIPVFTELFGITEEEVFGNQAPFDFDVSVKDIYSTIYRGATCALIPRKMFSVPTELLDYLEERKVTALVWAVSALCIVTTFNGFSYKVPSRIRKVLFSGEVMPLRHLNKWRKAYPEALFVNLYGPTEITCNCTYYRIANGEEFTDRIPIGIPFPNERVFLLSEEEQSGGKDLLITEREPEKEGEICVAGTCLSLGYYRNEAQTKKAFVQNPLNPELPEIIYRTGDLGYYGKDGLLYYSSRKDFQIKHMGHRIELGEIERAMDRVEGVERCVVLFREEKKKICAFYEGNTDKETIVKAIGEILPSFMIPNVFTEVPRLPITKNGKIDRRALEEEYWK